MRTNSLINAAWGVLLGASCLASAAVAQTTHVVDVDDNFFDPETVIICLGDSVRWEWVGNLFHSSTSGNDCGQQNGIWNSPVQSNGDFTHAFPSVPAPCGSDNSPGANTCNYFCSQHCGVMLGVVEIVEEATSDLSLSVNKLRVAHDGEGRGGTIRGILTLNGATWDDVDKSTRAVMLTLDGGFGSAEDLVDAPETRNRYSRDNTLDVNITTVVLQERSPQSAKLTLKYETNGLNLSGPLTATVDILQTVLTGCGGPADATASGAVAK